MVFGFLLTSRPQSKLDLAARTRSAVSAKPNPVRVQGARDEEALLLSLLCVQLEIENGESW